MRSGRSLSIPLLTPNMLRHSGPAAPQDGETSRCCQVENSNYDNVINNYIDVERDQEVREEETKFMKVWEDITREQKVYNVNDKWKNKNLLT